MAYHRIVSQVDKLAIHEDNPHASWMDHNWPVGSGSSFHIDPNSTFTWNAVVNGSKKWVLFPPNVIPPSVHPSPDGVEVACPVFIIEWFMNFYGVTKNWKKRPIECICKVW
ncbi:unnamed protein product [Dovyalis caffra]|uniref:JmjC domain-containing protein n=1 Tax=Dovyalis caffra TaxID=77055 RepID=A0AAV1SE78_9ROSI|nr:unnamed protein product [Dovyalis caffra]